MENNEQTPKYQIGDIVVGKVTGIQNYGAFVIFNDDCQGLIHISEISSKFVRNILDFITIGSEIRVKVIDIDPKTKNARLSLKAVTERERQVIRKPPVLKKAKIKIPEEELDFKPLEEKLPIWIEEALAKGDK